jgi:hypothetical protein
MDGRADTDGRLPASAWQLSQLHDGIGRCGEWQRRAALSASGLTFTTTA